MDGNVYRSMIQVREGALLSYAKYVGPLSYVRKNRINIDVKRDTYQGLVTASVKKSLATAIDVFLQLSPERLLFNKITQTYHTYRLGFMTLTISDTKIRCNSEVQKRCLRPFLMWLRRQGVTAYIWKAELQRRGQIHYHVTINSFVHYSDIRNKWNSLQRKAGYLNHYAKVYGHFNPNSTDIHSVAKIKNISAYMTKYLIKEVSKAESGKRIKGRVWDCSMNLKGGRFSEEATDIMCIELLNNKGKCVKVIEGDHFTMYTGLVPGHAGFSFEANYNKWINDKKK